MLNRETSIESLRARRDPWDIVIIGGGATGLGVAVDAASRGYDVALLEQCDFAKGTSSRSTKLIHGGVRYLQRGNVSLVVEALRERGRLRRNAPHIVSELPFIVPSYEWWQSPFYGIGLKVYDLLAGRYGFGRSSFLSRESVIEAIPAIQTDGLRSGIRYYDGQFDDARLALALAATANDHGATVCNYVAVTGLLRKDGGMLTGVTARDCETEDVFEVPAKVVVNATGPFSDAVRRMEDPEASPIIAPSQGVHVVLDRSFLAGDSAIMVPHTDDGRIMFAIPWKDVVIVGTTDTPIDRVDLEPRPQPEEIEFIFDTANRYLARPATVADARSVYAGIRPLVREGDSSNTAAISREHSVLIDPDSGLLTIAGGKWTTYRRMAEDAVDHAMMLGDLDSKKCVTEDLPIHGHDEHADRFGRLAAYGSDAADIEALLASDAEMSESIHPRLSLTVGEVIWACRSEMARTVDDMLARRVRALIRDARAALEAAPRVARIMASELNRDANWVDVQIAEFAEIAAAYIPAP